MRSSAYLPFYGPPPYMNYTLQGPTAPLAVRVVVPQGQHTNYQYKKEKVTNLHIATQRVRNLSWFESS